MNTVKAMTPAEPDDPILQDEALWDIVASGDLKALTPSQRAQFYIFRCKQEGLNPASQPFTYLVLNGKGILYGNKSAADQLRKRHGISIVDLTFFDDGEYLTYEITMQDREGRRDIDVGQVFVGGTKGEQRANARMKAISKAKRRATYSICGTGVLDETEIETIPGSKVYDDLKEAGFPERSGESAEPIPAQPISARQINRDTGEITSSPQRAESGALPGPLSLDDDIRRLRGVLGWSAQDVIGHADEHGINIRTREGKQGMIDRLQGYVDAMNADEEPEYEPGQGSFVEAQSWAAGEPGMDKHTA